MLNRQKFYAGLRADKELFLKEDGSVLLSESQVAGIENLLNVWEKYFFADDVNYLAYNLATAYHETGAAMQPIKEFGDRSYFNKYEPGTQIGKVLGNTQPGDGYRFRGEGHVQNTGRANARKATKRLNEIFKLGIDLEKTPDKRGDPFVSAMSLFLGNKEGWWTGKDLDDFIDTKDESDEEDLREFIDSRYVVNGKDKALKIGRYALSFEAALRAAGYEPTKAPPPAVPPAVPLPPKPPADSTNVGLAAVISFLLTAAFGFIIYLFGS